MHYRCINWRCLAYFLLVPRVIEYRKPIPYRFPDIDAFSSKITCFSDPTLVWSPLAEEHPQILLYSRPINTAEKYVQLALATILSLTIRVYLKIHE